MTAPMITAIAEDGSHYPIDKLEAHARAVPHLAVSIFVTSGDRLLLQQRAAGKYHSGGLWANTCCSHPAWTESVEDCARRRLVEEVGLTVPLLPIGTIRYQAAVASSLPAALYENELAFCFHGETDAAAPLPPADPEEVMALAWRPFADVLRDVEAQPEHFAPWFRLYLRHHRPMLDPLFGAGS